MQKDSGPLETFTDEQIALLGQSINTLEKEDETIMKEEIEEKQKKYKKNKYSRFNKTSIAIVNRILFVIFFITFVFSFALVFSVNRWLFMLYIVSFFSCIFYTPNRKVVKELIDAWPNVQDLLMREK